MENGRNILSSNFVTTSTLTVRQVQTWDKKEPNRFQIQWFREKLTEENCRSLKLRFEAQPYPDGGVELIHPNPHIGFFSTV